MAIYSCSVKTVSRSGGRSATAAAAYRNAEQIDDHRTGEIHDYRRRSGVDAVVAFVPAGMQPMSSVQLWNAAEAAEKRKNSTVAREVLVALPHELGPDQRHTLVQQIAQRLADRYQVAGTAAIHQPDQEGDNRNWHSHILMTTRRMEPTGELGAKTRELDAKATGAGEVKWIRTMVAGETNAALARAGLAERVDHRSLAEQQAAALEAGDQQRAGELSRLPTVHEGPTVTEIRRRGGHSQVAQINDARREVSAERAELRQVEAEIYQIEDARVRRDAEALRVEMRNARLEMKDLLRTPGALQRAEQTLQRGELERVIEQLDQPAFYPSRWDEAISLYRERNSARERCEVWQREHRLMARFMGVMGLEPAPVRAARQAENRYKASPAVREAIAWRKADREREQALSDARQRLERLLEQLPPESGPENPPGRPQGAQAAGQQVGLAQQLSAGLEALQRHHPGPEKDPDADPEVRRGPRMG